MNLNKKKRKIESGERIRFILIVIVNQKRKIERLKAYCVKRNFGIEGS